MNTPDPDILNEMVRRIVEVAHPLRIILFGSAARGEMGPDSDLDLLVVMPDGIHRRQTARRAFRALRGMGLSKDIIVVTKQLDFGQTILKYFVSTSIFSCFRQYLPIALGRA